MELEPGVIYASHGELRGRDDVVHASLPTDFVFLAGQRRVGVESKKPQDLLNSDSSRRLHRQLRKCLDVFDIVGLMLRGGWPHTDWRGQVPLQLYKDIVGWQVLGVVILPGPQLDSEVVPFLKEYRGLLTGGRRVLQVLAGTDKHVERKARGWYLQGIKGVGPTTRDKLMSHFGSVRAALDASDEEWYSVGANKAQVRARKEALE